MLLVLVLGVGASFAADTNQTEIQASDDADTVVSITETDTVSSNDNDTVISVNDYESNAILESMNQDILSANDVHTFTELSSEISKGGKVTLNYKYYQSDSTTKTIVSIPSNTIIDGNNAVINGTQSGTTTYNYIIQLPVGVYTNITIKNINFVNGNRMEFRNVTNLVIENCTFTNMRDWCMVLLGISDSRITNVRCKNIVNGFYTNQQSADLKTHDVTFNKCSITTTTDYGFQLYNSYLITFQDCTFIGVDSSLNGRNGGSRIEGSSSNITIWGCKFINGSTAISGGALNYGSGSQYNLLKNCYFEHNIAGARGSNCNGGAIEFYARLSTVDNCTFINNIAKTASSATNDGMGGAIVLYNGANNVTIINSKFINNTASEYGGAIGSQNPNCKDTHIINCIFEGNKAPVGGAIYYRSTGTIMTDCHFESNEATGATFSWGTYESSGGAVMADAANSTVSGCTFENNVAKDGDNFYASSVENTIEVEDCAFDLLYISNTGNGDGLKSENPANWTYAYARILSGGKIVLTSGNYNTLVNLIINKPVIIVGDGTVTVNANNNGRVFTVNSDNVNITSIKFQNGKADKGGAILWNGDYGILSKCTFTSNSATNNGGALYVAGSSLTSTSNTFTSNSATNGGGAVYVEGNNVFIGSSTFSSNSAKYGGAIYNSGKNLVISEYTYTSNAASIEGPNLYSTGTYTQAAKTYYPTLTVNVNDVSYGNNVVISGSLSDYYNGAVIDLLLNGNKVGTVTVINGAFSTTVTRPAAGAYTVTLGGSDTEGNAYSYTYTPKTFYVYHEDSFYALQKLINAASTSLTLVRNYNYYAAYDSKNGVVINKAFTLNGNGFTINGKNAARLLSVTAYYVNVQDVVLINGYSDENGGALYWNGAEGKINGVTFTGNNANNYNNVYSTKTDLQITNSVFNNIAQTITPTSTSVNYGNDFGVTATFNDGTNLNTNVLALTGNGASLVTTTNGNSVSYTYSKPLPNTYTLTFANSDNNGNTYTYSPSGAQVTVNRASTIYVAPTNKGLGLTESTATTWDNVVNLLTNDGTIIFTGGTYSNFYGKTINQGWTLQAASGATPVLDANNTGRIFTVSANNVKINGLTFKNGKTTDSYGSAIHWTGIGGTLTNSVLTQNTGRPVTATTTLTITNNQLKDQITLTKSNINWAETETITGTFAHNAPSTVNILFNGTSQGSYSVASGKVTASYAFTNPSTRSVGSYVVSLTKIYKF